ncbi:MAG TPA: 16S rRNA (cytosine(1402)-N(4))-methyltransferase RsmH [Anaerolineaceae bacterium]
MSDQGNGDRSPHLPVLYQEIITALDPKSPGKYVDGTLGAGGHAWSILNASAPSGMLLGLDLDPQALALARERLSLFADRTIIRQASYTSLQKQLAELGWDGVKGILLDLGVSSMQLDTPDRGFSFQTNAPLDMRFSPENPTTASDLVNRLTERQLGELIWRFGEEPHAHRIARAIVFARPITSTRHLAEVIARASGHQHHRIHPATLTFQALRISVNRELETLEEVLPIAIRSLTPRGRIAIIAFHSLEDRIVKQFFHKESRDCLCPPEVPVCVCGHKATLIEITRHPIQASAEEVQRNPRARSAKLRVAERI